MLSESGLESIHAQINQINRLYATICNKTMQAQPVFQNQSVTSKMRPLETKEAKKMPGLWMLVETWEMPKMPEVSCEES